MVVLSFRVVGFRVSFFIFFSYRFRILKFEYLYFEINRGVVRIELVNVCNNVWLRVGI